MSVLSSNAFVPYEGSSSLYLVGEVYNGTGQNVRFIKIIANLRDSQGNVVASDYTYADIDPLSPGMISPFLVLLISPPAYSTYDLTLDWDTSDSAPYILQILNQTTRFDTFNAFHVAGEAVNQFSDTRTYVRAVVTLYDQNHKVIGTDYTYLNPDTLTPGQNGTFDVDVYFYVGKPYHSAIATYSLIVVDD